MWSQLQCGLRDWNLLPDAAGHAEQWRIAHAVFGEIYITCTQASASSPSLLALAPAPTAYVRQSRAQAGTSTCPCCRRRAVLLYKCTFCSVTVPTVCTITVMQQENKWRCPGSIPDWSSGQTRHFWSITSITCFSSLLPWLLLIRPSLLHPLLPCYYYIITYYYCNNVSIITQVCYYRLLLIITSVITSLLPIIIRLLLPIITVIMDPLLPIITRSIIRNNGSIITYYWPGQFADVNKGTKL